MYVTAQTAIPWKKLIKTWLVNYPTRSLSYIKCWQMNYKASPSSRHAPGFKDHKRKEHYSNDLNFCLNQDQATNSTSWTSAKASKSSFLKIHAFLFFQIHHTHAHHTTYRLSFLILEALFSNWVIRNKFSTQHPACGAKRVVKSRILLFQDKKDAHRPHLGESHSFF